MTRKPRTTVYRVPQTSPLGASVNDFLLDCEARNLTPPTVRFYWQRLFNLLTFLHGQDVMEPRAIIPALQFVTHEGARMALLSEEARANPYYIAISLHPVGGKALPESWGNAQDALTLVELARPTKVLRPPGPTQSAPAER